MTSAQKSPKCDTPLGNSGENCVRCLLALSLEAPVGPGVGPSFLDDLVSAAETQMIADRYRIVSAVGRGSFGMVYKALQLNLNRVVAVSPYSLH